MNDSVLVRKLVVQILVYYMNIIMIIGNLLCCELTDLFDTLVCLARFIDATHEVVIQQNTCNESVHTFNKHES